MSDTEAFSGHASEGTSYRALIQQKWDAFSDWVRRRRWWVYLGALALGFVLGLLLPWNGPWWLAMTAIALVLAFELRPSPALGKIRQVIGAMWVPLAVLVLGGVALFGTDQGRDLGVGLLGANWRELTLLALALFYWALASWLAASFGRDRTFDGWYDGVDPSHETSGEDPGKWWLARPRNPWLVWLPRLIGACVHLYATVTLALAAEYFDGRELSIFSWLLYFLPTLIILLSLACLGYIWWRGRGDVPGDSLRLTLRDAAAVVVAAGLLATLPVFLFSKAAGFAWASLAVLLSAAAFLLVVVFRRDIEAHINAWLDKRRSQHAGHRPATDDREQIRFHSLEQVRSHPLMAFLLLVALIVAVFAWIAPVTLGRWTGSMVLGFFAFGVYVTAINLIVRSERRAAIGAFLLLLVIGTSLVRSFHPVRLCGEDGPCKSNRDAIDERLTVEQAAQRWYDQAKLLHKEDEPVPMLVVATAGGGIRAAYWTAYVLERLDARLGENWLRRHLFAISGVSGGSVGAAAYMAALKAAPCGRVDPTEMFEGRDFLAPALASLAFVDVPSSVLPDLGQTDRASALERAFELGSESELLARPFLSFFPAMEEPCAGAWRPALLLNSAHQDTGRRVITSHLKIERDTFLNAFDAHHLLGDDMPASTAAHNSARFTYVSPAGRLLPAEQNDRGGPALELIGLLSAGKEDRLERSWRGFLLDGGYFENFGAITALQLVRRAQRAIETDDGRPVKLVVLQISSDPSLSSRDRARTTGEDSVCLQSKDPAQGNFLEFDPSRFEWVRDPETPDLDKIEWKSRDSGGLLSAANELTAPLAGVMESRVAHGVLASKELARAFCPAEPGEDGAPANGAPDIADGLGIGKDALTVAGVEPTAAERSGGNRNDGSEGVYAHIAMCDDPGAIRPPLGWVLADADGGAGGFEELLSVHCGNEPELDRLVGSLCDRQDCLAPTDEAMARGRTASSVPSESM